VPAVSKGAEENEKVIQSPDPEPEAAIVADSWMMGEPAAELLKVA
jgi:hypothetical protein